MRKAIFTLTALVLLAAPAAADMTLKLYDSYGTTNGGEFLAQPISGWTVVPASLGQAAGKFETFCLEKTEYIYFNTLYYAVSNTKAIQGSVGPGGDPLSPLTAYLYDRFIEGQLSNYDYGTGTLRVTSANELQEALWYLEGETTSATGQAALWIQEAVNATGLAFGSYVPNAGSAVYSIWGNTIGDVRILNLYRDAARTQLAQDQLVKIPAPAALLLGAIGLGAVGLIMRRFA